MFSVLDDVVVRRLDLSVIFAFRGGAPQTYLVVTVESCTSCSSVRCTAVRRCVEKTCIDGKSADDAGTSTNIALSIFANS